MTLSNFDWTDKTSIKWFILLPTGHEGPYSLEHLQVKKNTSHDIKIWAEGLASAVTLKVALENARQKPIEIETPVAVMDMVDDDVPPPLPPLPEEEKTAYADLVEETSTEEAPAKPMVMNPRFKMVGLLVGVFLVTIFGLKEWARSKEEFSMNRLDRMSPETFRKILNDHKFEGWGKKIFFKEYVPSDMSHVWLVTSGFQHCSIDAQFSSLKGKLLTKDDSEKVTFKSSTILKGHVAQFSNFDFINGNKIIPGLYEMDLKASKCEWDGLAAKVGNWFKSPDESYVTRMKVVLYHKGSVEFNVILDKLIRAKMDLEIKNQNQEQLFWQDLQQKFQTLLSISLQIEQHVLDFLDAGTNNYESRMKKMVEIYTRKFGHFLTSFVVDNEKYFKELEKSELSNMGQKRTYESSVRLTSKRVGLDSMKLIEDLQKLKKPTKKDLEAIEVRAKKSFELLKDVINTKLIQVTEDSAQ